MLGHVKEMDVIWISSCVIRKIYPADLQWRFLGYVVDIIVHIHIIIIGHPSQLSWSSLKTAFGVLK